MSQQSSLTQSAHSVRQVLTAYICPICDGFEAMDRRIGVLGFADEAGRKALFLRTYSRHVILFHKEENIGRVVGCTTGTASKWRVRYAERRLAGLDETGKRGAEPKYTAETNKRILRALDGPPPAGYGRWSGPLIARALGDVDVQYVWRFLRAQKIDLSGRKSWCESNDPEFAAKANMAPPENAIVICVDEKPSVQTLERAIFEISQRPGADWPQP